MTYNFKTCLAAGFAALSISISGCADAQSAASDTSSSDVVLSSTATNWDIQAEGSHIRFSALQEGKPFSGLFAEFSGAIRFDPATPETGIVDISIPLGSVDAGSKDRNSTLPSKVWFSSKAFPEARFKSNTISRQDAGYLAKGELTLKGKSVRLDLPFTLQIDGDQAVMTGAAELDRTLWNIGAAPWDTDEWVSRQVNLDIQVTAIRGRQ